MKKILLSIALAVVAPVAWAQVSQTTTTTTDGSDVITEDTPGSVTVLRESSEPRTYRFGKTVTYVTRSGKVLDADVVRTRVKVGVPVRVHFVGTGDNMVVDRVILDEDEDRERTILLSFPVPLPSSENAVNFASERTNEAFGSSKANLCRARVELFSAASRPRDAISIRLEP